MTEPLDAVAYLARSENRLAILEAADERPCSRRDLEAEAGVSRSTLSRALRELQEERGWLRRTDDGFTTTTAGSLVMERFLPLLRTVDALETLDHAMAFLPVEEMAIDVHHFHDAEFMTPSEFDPTAPFEYGVGRLRESGSLRSVGQLVPPAYVRAVHEGVAAGELDLEIVLSGEYVDAVADSELGELWAETAARPSTGVLRSAEEPPYNLLVLDDVVHLWLCSDEGEQAGLVESENPAVREWAQSAVDAHREDATPLAAGVEA